MFRIGLVHDPTILHVQVWFRAGNNNVTWSGLVCKDPAILHTKHVEVRFGLEQELTMSHLQV